MLKDSREIIDANNPKLKQSYNPDEVIGITVKDGDYQTFLVSPKPLLNANGNQHVYWSSNDIKLTTNEDGSTKGIFSFANWQRENKGYLCTQELLPQFVANGSVNYAIPMAANTYLDGKQCWLPDAGELNYIIGVDYPEHRLAFWKLWCRLGNEDYKDYNGGRFFWSSTYCNSNDNGISWVYGRNLDTGNLDGLNVLGMNLCVPITRL